MLAARPLDNKLILLIDSNSFLAEYFINILKRAGGQVIGPARTAEEATTWIDRLRERPSAAVVSNEVLQASGSAIGHALARLGIPMLLTVSERPTYGEDAGLVNFSFIKHNFEGGSNDKFTISDVETK